MLYKISEAAKKLNIPPSTLRFYDKEGFLPFVDRSSGGIRVFKDADFEWLNIIECLKRTGMPIKDIKSFIDWCMEGDSTIQQRYNMFHERKKIVETQIAELQKILDTIKYKCWYYETTLAARSTKVHEQMTDDDMPEGIKEIKERLNLPYN